MTTRGVRRYVADLIRGRRPRPFRATPDDVAEVRAAIELRSAAPGSAEPSEAFVAGLRQRLATELAAEPTQPAGNPSRATRTRRRVVQATSLAAASVAVGVATDRVVTASGGAAAPPLAEPTLTPTDGVWRVVSAARDLPEGGVVPFDLGSVVGFVHRTNGQLRAVSGICTHLGCRLALDGTHRRLDCPCHRTAFTVAGEVLSHQLPVQPPPLPHLPVRESGDAIEILAPPSPS